MTDQRLTTRRLQWYWLALAASISVIAAGYWCLRPVMTWNAFHDAAARGDTDAIQTMLDGNWAVERQPGYIPGVLNLPWIINLKRGDTVWSVAATSEPANFSIHPWFVDNPVDLSLPYDKEYLITYVVVDGGNSASLGLLGLGHRTWRDLAYCHAGTIASSEEFSSDGPLSIGFDVIGGRIKPRVAGSHNEAGTRVMGD